MSGAGERQETSRTRHVDAAISRRFRELREALGLTRRQVAADMGASEGRWQAYESGERIPASRIWQFCSRYGLDVSVVYAGMPFSIGPVESVPPTSRRGQVEEAAMAGMAEDGTAFEPASGRSHDPSSDDATLRAISEAAADLNPLERSLALAALRGMGAQKLKTP
jgi:transcriptional regulator with XRE-family HTH domain